MNCACKKAFKDIDKFIFHLKYVHKTYTFTCPFKKCLRAFHRKDSFKKHVLQVHDLHCADNPTDNDILLCSVYSNLIENQFRQNNAFNNDNESLSLGIDNEAECQSNKLTDFCQFFEFSFQTLISSFYDNLSLTKTAVQTIIIKLITEFFLKVSCNDIENKILI